jgi:hypothetical protein
MENGEATSSIAAAPQWLIDLKAMAAGTRARKERPAGKPFGRWLGDFLDQDTASGLLSAEEKLLFAAAAGEACVLQSRAARLWAVFDGWRKTLPQAEVPVEEDFAEAMAKFLGGAPEAVQEVIHDATFHAFLDAGLPEGWEPQNETEAHRLATAQRAYFKRLEQEADPAGSIRKAKGSGEFFLLAHAVTLEALTRPPGGKLVLKDKSFSPLLRPLNLSAELSEKIEAQPRVLRDFFAELVRHVQAAPGMGQAYLTKLKADPTVLRVHFDAAFTRYEREAWRWVDPHDPEVRLRASFLRFLSLGGDDAAPVHEKELHVQYAYVAEDLDLSGCTIPQPLWFFRCYFAGRPLFRDAISKSLYFPKSHVKAIAAQGAHIHGSVYLEDGFWCKEGVNLDFATIDGPLSFKASKLLPNGDIALSCESARIAGGVALSDGLLAEGAVLFTGTEIGGDLNCAGSVFRNRTGDGSGVALGCDNAAISGNAVLAHGFRAEGSVSFSGARIGGSLNCIRGIFVNRSEDETGRALTCGYTKIEGNVYLGDGFSAQGQVRFHGADVKGSILCAGGRFDNLIPVKADGTSIWRPHLASALYLQSARIGGTLSLGPHAADARAKADIAGSLNLAGSHAHEIVDHSSSWPAAKIAIPGGKRLPAFIYLDGFTYDRLGGRGDYGVGVRMKWLDRRPPRDFGVEFRPQPFEQLIEVYREMGHERHAREIAKFKERRRYQSRFIKLWHGWRNSPGLARGIFGDGVFGAALNWLAWPFAILARAFSRSLRSILLGMEWFIIGAGTGYGYGYFRLVLFLIAIWIAGGLLYATAADQGAFAPSNPVIYLNKELEAKCGRNWADCKGATPALPSFSPFTYSLDNMLPLLDLGQKRDWQPIDRPDHPMKIALPQLTWYKISDPRYSEIPEVSMEVQPLGEGTLDRIVRLQTLLSWAALGLLIAILSGLIKKD